MIKQCDVFTSKRKSTGTDVSISTTNHDQAFRYYRLIDILPSGTCTNARSLSILGDDNGAEISEIDSDAVLDVRRIVKGSMSATLDSEWALSELADHYCRRDLYRLVGVEAARWSLRLLLLRPVSELIR